VSVVFGLADLFTTATIWTAFVLWYWPITGPEFLVRWLVPRFCSKDRYIAIAVKNAGFKELALKVLLEVRCVALVTIPITAVDDVALHPGDHSLLYRCYLLACYGFFEYWLYKLGKDDDRWKKRRKKAAAKVKEVAGKLVVVPVPAGA